MNKFTIIMITVFSLYILFIIVFNFLKIQKQYKIPKTYNRTTGIINDYVMEEQKAKRKPKIRYAQILYKIKNDEYVCYVKEPFKNEIGNNVNLWYNPNNPCEIKLLKNNKDKFIEFGMLVYQSFIKYMKFCIITCVLLGIIISLILNI